MSAKAERAGVLARWRRTDVLERISRAGTLAMLAVGLGAAALAPILALSWSNQPFAGMLVEQTLVVNGIGGEGWTARAAGLDFPQKISRIGGQPAKMPSEYHAVLNAHAVGDSVSVIATEPDGSTRYYQAVELMAFGARDALRLFVLPYCIGLAYLAIGLWVYRLRGMTRPGRTLAFFCFSAAVVCMLFFDLSTTHVGTAFWALAVAMTGGAILSLAMRFPTEWEPVRRAPWLLAVPYVASMVLGAWVIAATWDFENPWAYIGAWGASYRYVALAIVAFLLVMLHRATSSESPVARKQALIVLAGSGLAFTPIAVWFAAPLFGHPAPFEPVLYLPPLVVFPLSVSVAILRYRMLEIELIVSRALLYALLTAILTAAFTVTITVLQKAFVAVTGEKSDVALVVTTLFVVVAVTPLKNRLQEALDRRLKTSGTIGPELADLVHDADLVSRIGSPEAIGRGFLARAATALRADGGALSVPTAGSWRTLAAHGRWTGDAHMVVPIEHAGVRLGVLSLGPRKDGRAYTRAECDALGRAAADVARSWLVAESLRSLAERDGGAADRAPAPRADRPARSAQAHPAAPGGP